MARTVIVTGSARGIGKSIALRLAKDGYDVCINDIEANKAGAEEVAKEVQSMGRKSIVVIADVSKRAQVEAMVAESVSKLGPLNTMVANAGIAQVKPILEVTEEDMERMFQVNLYGVNNCYNAAAKQMIKQGKLPDGAMYKIIGAASIAGFKSFALLGHYSSSKWAVRGLTQAYAMEVAEHGITVNGYAPGIVGTDMWVLIDKAMGNSVGAKPGEIFKKYSDQLIALKRSSEPDDIGKLVHYLASPDSDYMTGQCIIQDGGIFLT